MWILPSALFHSARVRACLTLESKLPAPSPGLYVFVSGKAQLRPYCWSGWKTRPWSQRLFSQATSLTSTGLRSLVSQIAWSQDFPASHGPSQASSGESKTSAGYGKTLQNAFVWYDRNTSSWKTSQACLLPGLDTYSEAWPKWGLMLHGEASRQAPWEPATAGKGCLSWPTPRSQDSKHGAATEYELNRDPSVDLLHVSVERHWPTPAASVVNDGESAESWEARRKKLKLKGTNGNGAGKPLTVASVSWPTPAARDGKGANSREHCETGKGRAHMDQLPNFVAHSLPPVPTTQDGETSSSSTRRLNPRFVEILMGWPVGWTGYEFVEMESYRYKLRSHLLNLVGDSMRECKTCGIVLEGTSRYRGSSRHEKKCKSATPAERAHFKRLGHWPKPGQTVKPLPPEVPEAPPVI